MTGTLETRTPYAATFQDALTAHPGEPEWLTSLRHEAFGRFQSRGWPTTRDEEWKYTPIAQRVESRSLALEAAATADPARLDPFLTASRGYHRLVFVNGRLDDDASDLDGLPAGLTITPLDDALEDADLRRALERRAAESVDGARDINLALAHHGAVVRVAAGTKVEAPIYLLHLGVPGPEGYQAHGVNLVITGDGAEATVIESFVGLEPGPALGTFHTSLIAEENSGLEYLAVVHRSDGSTHFHQVHGRQARASRINSFVLDVAGGLSRTEMEFDLEGEGAECSLKGLYLTHDDEHVDMRTVVNHRVPHCRSEQEFKGILDGRSSATFNGKIVVHEDAQKTDATQSNRNLLLSRDAVINTKPQLEIYADDVKCAHGATTGRLDEGAIFYLRSRGIDRQAAEALLTYAFASELIESVRFEPLRQEFEEFLLARLPVRPPEGDAA